MSEFAATVRAVLSERTCVVGLGNPWRNDDGIGPHVATRLLTEGVLPSHIRVVNVEDVIESYAFDIARSSATNVVLVDAVLSEGATAGSLVFGRLDDLEAPTPGLSTHKLALQTVGSVFSRFGKQTYLLGIVSRDADFGTVISDAVQAGGEAVIDLVRSARSC